jgi:uncharacterized membrane protein YjgN (DUF898 family)
MAEFQTILGIILIVAAVVIIAITIYNLVIIGKATVDTEDLKAKLTDGEKKGALALNIMLILVALVIGVYGVVIILPSDRATAGVPSLRTSRSLSGAVLTPTGDYM